jgi:hypothetical protein
VDLYDVNRPSEVRMITWCRNIVSVLCNKQRLILSLFDHKKKKGILQWHKDIFFRFFYFVWFAGLVYFLLAKA